MCPIGDKHLRDRYALLLNALYLRQEILWIDGGACAHHAGAGRIKNAARYQVELEFAEVVHDRMARIAAALEAHAQIYILAQEINKLALPLIPPLRANDYYY
jgi:hypothetical protein